LCPIFFLLSISPVIRGKEGKGGETALSPYLRVRWWAEEKKERGVEKGAAWRERPWRRRDRPKGRGKKKGGPGWPGRIVVRKKRRKGEGKKHGFGRSIHMAELRAGRGGGGKGGTPPCRPESFLAGVRSSKERERGGGRRYGSGPNISLSHASSKRKSLFFSEDQAGP